MTTSKIKVEATAKPVMVARPQGKPDPVAVAKNVLARYPKIMARLAE